MQTLTSDPSPVTSDCLTHGQEPAIRRRQSQERPLRLGFLGQTKSLCGQKQGGTNNHHRPRGGFRDCAEAVDDIRVQRDGGVIGFCSAILCIHYP